jgi:hypothetical protein
VNGSTFKRLARLRLHESSILLHNDCYQGAYYLCGYSVEFALKACIANRTKKGDFPPRVDEVRDLYTHNLGKLLVKVGNPLREAIEKDRARFVNWALVKDWSEEKRYELLAKPQARLLATTFHRAVADMQTGILPCIEQYW